MANFVLVPGFWLGGWAWKAVTDVLRENGHAVYPVTLTGLGERVHLGNAQTNLDTHVADVVNLIEFEELDDVYLVGHSYGGVVITQVADKIPERLAKLIYVDSAPLPDGVATIEFQSPERLAAFENAVATHGDGWRLPLPSWNELDEGNNLKDLTKRLCTSSAESFSSDNHPHGQAFFQQCFSHDRARLPGCSRYDIHNLCLQI